MRVPISLQEPCRRLWLTSLLCVLSSGGCLQNSPPANPPGSVEQSDGSQPATIDTTTSEPAPAETNTSSATTNNTAPNSVATTVAPDPATELAPPAAETPLPPPPEVEGLKRLAPDFDVWADFDKKRVLIAGRVVRQEGQLEMFACLKNTKEHEAVVAVNSKAFIINAALIAIGAKQGSPVQFRPEFKPAWGPEVEVTVIWTDAEGKRRQARGQDWIRDIKTGKQLEQPWVFGGSGFWVDEATGQKHFMAEDGDFICISNFNSAMLDLPVESSQASSQLQFEAFTERIPPVKTPVLVVLTPKLKQEAEADEKPATRKPAEPATN